MRRSNKDRRREGRIFREERVRRELNQKARRAAEHKALRARESQPIGI
jgi:hypothetical protein